MNLLAEVQRARAARDSTGRNLEEVRAALAEAQQRHSFQATELADMRQQLVDVEACEADQRVECESLRGEVAEAERQVKALEEAAKRAQQRQAELEASKGNLLQARHKADVETNVLEWRLQKTVSQIAREKPGTPFGTVAKCLLSKSTGLGSKLSHRRQDARSKRSGEMGGTDADESTTAGEWGAGDGGESESSSVTHGVRTKRSWADDAQAMI